MAEPTARAYRDVLAIPGARALIGASAASQIGNWLYNAALLGYVYGETRSAGWVGAATICRLVPYVLLGPFGGAIADRYPRRAVLLAGDVLRVLVMAALAATVASAGPVALVIAFTALASAAGCAEKPAAMALRRAWSVRPGSARPTRYCTPSKTSASLSARRSERSCSGWLPPGSHSWPTGGHSPSPRC
jgi:MFS family permease